MKLVPADEITPWDREMQEVLNAHPDLKQVVTRLLNSYREMALMGKQGQDTADLVRSIAKNDLALWRIGITVDALAESIMERDRNAL